MIVEEQAASRRWTARTTGQLILDAGVRLVQHEGFELSGYIAFTAILSLFPFLIFLTALAGFLGNAASADQVIATVFELAPPEVAQVLAPILRDVLTQQHGGLATVSILFALWTASSGVEALSR